MQHPILLPALSSPPDYVMRGIRAGHTEDNASEQRIHSAHLQAMPQMWQGNIVV